MDDNRTRASELPRSCSVVDSIDCECPPNGMIGDPPPVICYACGDDVCRNCSTLITYHKRRCRVCFNCQDTRKIGRSSPASEASCGRERGPQGSSDAPAAAALTALRKLHRLYVRSCGSRFRDVPFRARTVPGWVYDPTTDTIRRVRTSNRRRKER